MEARVDSCKEGGGCSKNSLVLWKEWTEPSRKKVLLQGVWWPMTVRRSASGHLERLREGTTQLELTKENQLCTNMV